MITHARERALERYGAKYYHQDQFNEIYNCIKKNKFDIVKYEDDKIIHIVLYYDSIYFLLVYDRVNNFIITVLPPVAIKNEDYPEHDYFYRKGKIIHINEFINIISFKLYREYLS